ncbi:hypothetical protein LF599_00660 [Pseudodesulfovibrio thermohalotolerans]|uniref:hypothetical protein n=1 Tax=Pseudodesulfovibrio thermohalotolerans TaxID=2880651 RepID=UPI00244222EA|nr:hypothetical protein [Pseudodesulfovibrio thermohalotolerans]WFS62700.1 hypothetical protein LF599_00660 [Pseudodesulfovibrio thermohalotolerans]
MPNRPAHRHAPRTASEQFRRTSFGRIALLCLFLCLLLQPAGPALAERPCLTVGVERIDYPPYGSFRQGGYEGFARDLLDSFGIEHGYTMVYVALPVKRLYQEFLDTRTLDLKFPDCEEWNRSKRKGIKIFYSVPVCEYTDGILVKPENLGKGMEAIKTLGVIAGLKPWLLVPPVDKDAMKVSENVSVSGLLGKGIRDRVDGVYTNLMVASHLLEERGYKDKLVFDPDLPHATGHYHLSTIDHPLILREFDEFMKTRTELVDSIRRKHGIDR